MNNLQLSIKRAYLKFLRGDKSLSAYLEDELKDYSLLKRTVIIRDVYKKLSGAMTEQEIRGYIRKIHLSEKLYKNSKVVEKNTLFTLHKAMEKFESIKVIERMLYDGYEPDREEILRVKKALPKYLFNSKKAEELADKTKHLKEAYLQYLRAKTDKEIQKSLKVAFAEKARYFAYRIADTEEHRAFSIANAQEMIGDPEIKFVKYEMSSDHPMIDICDYHANLNVGYGKGIIPKENMISLPLHPHCHCRYKPYYKKVKFKPIKDPERATMVKFTKWQQSRILGSWDNYDKWVSGKKLYSIYNAGKPDIYKVQPYFKILEVIDETPPEPVKHENGKTNLTTESESNGFDEVFEGYRKYVDSLDSIDNHKKKNIKPVTNEDIEKAVDIIEKTFDDLAFVPDNWFDLPNEKRWDKEITYAVQNSIKEYTQTAYKKIRKVLTTTKGKKEILNDLSRAKKLAEYVQEIFKYKGNLEPGAVLYRGIVLKPNSEYIDIDFLKAREGDVVTFKSFSSFTLSQAKANTFSSPSSDEEIGVTFVVRTNDYHHLIAKYSDIQTEEEVLFDNHSAFKIVDISKVPFTNEVIYLLEEIPMSEVKKKVREDLGK